MARPRATAPSRLSNLRLDLGGSITHGAPQNKINAANILASGSDLPAASALPMWGERTNGFDAMSAVERLDEQDRDMREKAASAGLEAIAEEAQAAGEKSRVRLRPLLALAPYVSRHRPRATPPL